MALRREGDELSRGCGRSTFSWEVSWAGAYTGWGSQLTRYAHTGPTDTLPTHPFQTTAQLPYPKRVWRNLTGLFTSFEEPAFEKLLPDQVVDPQNPRSYTLVIDLDKFLVCHIWDREQGRWRIAKRPGAELFLFYAAQLYEVVVFSSLPQHEGDAIVKKLDPYGCISYSLYRFATKFKGGSYLKDIAHLNRDLAKVLVVGQDEAGFAPHPDNFVRVEPWLGDANDTVLEDSLDFLETLAFSRLADLRPVARQFVGKSFPRAFDQSQEASFNALQASQAKSLLGKIRGWLSIRRPGAEGGGGASSTDTATYWSRKQERLQLRRKEFARIKDLMEKQLQAEMQKEKDYYAEHKVALWDLFSKGPPAPPPRD